MGKPAVDNEAAPRAGADPLLGKTLDGRFRIIERLGMGGMGTVYKAVQAPLDRLVALKVLNANYDAKRDPGFQRRFFLEASVTSKLRHPNTITVIDYGKTDDGIYYLAMEYVEGVTLAQVLGAGPLPWQRALNITQQVCRSLREAHRAGIIHRDLKPANVMICAEETDQDLVKVLDFGLVKSFTEDNPTTKVSPSELTQAGVFLGSPQYMAPEQARNTADPRSDIYSLGVVLYQMVMGKPPFWAEQSIDVIVKHMKEAPPSFKAMRPDLDIPPDVEGLVMRCLEKEPTARFQSMEEMLEAIRVVAASGGTSGVFARSLPLTPPPMRNVSASGAYRNIPTPTPSGPQRLPQSGAFVRAPVNAGSGAYSKSAPRSGAFPRTPQGPSSSFEINVDDPSRSHGGVLSAARPMPKSRKWIPIAIFGATAVVGAAVLLAVLQGGDPAPEPVPTTAAAAVTPEPVKPPAAIAPPPATATATAADTTPTGAAGDVQPAAARLVRFRVLSEPLGATVTMDGKPLGTTPFAFELPPGGDGNAQAELTFELAGYHRTVLNAQGVGPEVYVTQRLKKVTAPTTTRPKSTDKPKVTGYKDDPY